VKFSFYVLKVSRKSQFFIVFFSQEEYKFNFKRKESIKELWNGNGKERTNIEI